MYDKNSDYALNKRSRDFIVCKSVTGEHIYLNREDFSSDEEFERWKAWSDKDYHETEKLNRRYDDRCFSLCEGMDTPLPSAEEIAINLADPNVNVQESDIRDVLTEKQYRRMKLYYLHKMTEAEIAAVDGVGQRRISTSLALGKKKLEKIISERRKNGG